MSNATNIYTMPWFRVHAYWLTVMEPLNLKQIYEIYVAVSDYLLNEQVPALAEPERSAFAVVRKSMDYDRTLYWMSLTSPDGPTSAETTEQLVPESALGMPYQWDGGLQWAVFMWMKYKEDRGESVPPAQRRDLYDGFQEKIELYGRDKVYKSVFQAIARDWEEIHWTA